MLSIPRDLWVQIPNVGENRINTAHFFAEAEQRGSGPEATMETIRQNFGITLNYYARIRFDGVKEIVDVLDGITIQLDQPMSGYNGGTHRINGEQALAFARDRSGSDDFFRMERGQFIIRSTINELLKPTSWVKLPQLIQVANQVIDSNLPVYLYPRLGLALVRAALSDSINSVTVNREMVTPFTTDQGASVLLPNWNAINPVLREFLGE
jgi:LCP family protein required for cell wall assembly